MSSRRRWGRNSAAIASASRPVSVRTSWPAICSSVAQQSALSRLSSATSTRSGLRAPRGAAPLGPAAGAGVAGASGSHDELAAAAEAVAAAPRSCRHAARRGPAPARGRCPGRPRSGRGGRGLREHVEELRQELRRDADAVVPHATTASSPTLRACTRSGRPVGVLGGVVQQVGEHLRQAHRVGLERPARGQLHAELVRRAPRSAAGPSRPRRPGSPRARALPAQLQLAARDARDVEQVVEQPRDVRDLALDHVLRPLQLRLGRARLLLIYRVTDRRERVAQLVRRASPGTRPCGGRPRAARPPRASGRSCRCLR